MTVEGYVVIGTRSGTFTPDDRPDTSYPWAKIDGTLPGVGGMLNADATPAAADQAQALIDKANGSLPVVTLVGSLRNRNGKASLYVERVEVEKS